MKKYILVPSKNGITHMNAVEHLFKPHQSTFTTRSNYHSICFQSIWTILSVTPCNLCICKNTTNHSFCPKQTEAGERDPLLHDPFNKWPAMYVCFFKKGNWRFAQSLGSILTVYFGGGGGRHFGSMSAQNPSAEKPGTENWSQFTPRIINFSLDISKNHNVQKGTL